MTGRFIQRRRRLSLRAALLIALSGVSLALGAPVLIERYVRIFPSVPDIIQARLPYVNFGIAGELYFLMLLIAAGLVLFRRQSTDLPGLLAMLGIFYGLRGAFIFTFPIGPPAGAPLLALRSPFYPVWHGYFPGGHAGLMTILSLSMRDRRWRAAFLIATALFAAGTVLSRAHYIADVLGGAVLGYAVFSWVRRHVDIGPAEPARAESAMAANPLAERTP